MDLANSFGTLSEGMSKEDIPQQLTNWASVGFKIHWKSPRANSAAQTLWIRYVLWHTHEKRISDIFLVPVPMTGSRSKSAPHALMTVFPAACKACFCTSLIRLFMQTFLWDVPAAVRTMPEKPYPPHDQGNPAGPLFNFFVIKYIKQYQIVGSCTSNHLQGHGT